MLVPVDSVSHESSLLDITSWVRILETMMHFPEVNFFSNSHFKKVMKPELNHFKINNQGMKGCCYSHREEM